MTRLELKLHQPNASGYIEAGAVASVRWLVDKSGSRVERWWREEKPLDVAGGDGQSGEYTVFQLPGGGRYSLDVRRPRGSTIHREYQIEDGADVIDLLTMRESPYEFLGWQKFAGIVRAGPPKLVMLEMMKEGETFGGERRPTPMVNAADVPSAVEAWSLVSAASRGGDRSAVMEHARPVRWHVVADDDEYVTWFPVMPQQDQVADLVYRLRDQRRPPDPLDETFPRWITVVSQGRMDLVSLPWAWGTERPDEVEEIRLVYDRIRSSPIDRDRPGHTIVGVQDKRWFSLLEFTAAGRLAAAETVAESVFGREDPREALFGKVQRPLVAVAGGIILLAGSARQAQEWDAWLENLCNWFPGVSDGAILLGCRRLQRAQDARGVRHAFDAVKLGWLRGIPFFSATIHMLSVALAQIGCEIEEADEIRRDIAAVTTRVDPNQPFTVIRL